MKLILKLDLDIIWILLQAKFAVFFSSGLSITDQQTETQTLFITLFFYL